MLARHVILQLEPACSIGGLRFAVSGSAGGLVIISLVKCLPKG